MAKVIQTLIPDIYETIQRKDGWFTQELAGDFSTQVARRLTEHLGSPTERRTLRLSRMGPTCPKALWHSVHTPELAEPLPPWAEIKYSYGHILEALAITLAKAAGHEVTGEQDELVLDGVYGHRDCVIDGAVVDVKSSSSIGFQKFKSGAIGQEDSFGYLDQLDGYVVASSEDPLVTVKDRGYLLVIDKQLGHMVLYEHYIRADKIRERIAEYKELVGRRDPPDCSCKSVPDGKSGNLKLELRASYSPYKHLCFPRLRTFLYADGPRYLTHVERMPDVPEIKQRAGISLTSMI